MPGPLGQQLWTSNENEGRRLNPRRRRKQRENKQRLKCERRKERRDDAGANAVGGKISPVTYYILTLNKIGLIVWPWVLNRICLNFFQALTVPRGVSTGEV
jgi:hypothetical protein